MLRGLCHPLPSQTKVGRTLDGSLGELIMAHRIECRVHSQSGRSCCVASATVRCIVASHDQHIPGRTKLHRSGTAILRAIGTVFTHSPFSHSVRAQITEAGMYQLVVIETQLTNTNASTSVLRVCPSLPRAVPLGNLLVRCGHPPPPKCPLFSSHLLRVGWRSCASLVL